MRSGDVERVHPIRGRKGGDYTARYNLDLQDLIARFDYNALTRVALSLFRPSLAALALLFASGAVSPASADNRGAQSRSSDNVFYLCHAGAKCLFANAGAEVSDDRRRRHHRSRGCGPVERTSRGASAAPAASF
jgi:hypothetical protein